MKKLLLIATVIVSWRVTETVLATCENKDVWTGKKVQSPCWEERRWWMNKEFMTKEEALEFIKSAPSNVDSIRIDGKLVKDKK